MHNLKVFIILQRLKAVKRIIFGIILNFDLNHDRVLIASKVT